MENHLHNLVFIFANHIRLSVPDRGIAKRRNELVSFQFGFLCHSTLHFNPKVIRIKLILPLDNHFDKPPIHSFHDGLRDAFNINLQFLSEHPFVKCAFVLIPGETRKFPDKDYLKRLWLFFSGCDHPLKFRSVIGTFAASSGSFHENIFFWNQNIMRFCISLDLIQLRFRADIQLVVRADTDISCTYSHFDHPFV